MSGQDSNQNFRDSVALSLLADPRPTLENLARNTGLTYEEVVHHALVRYASSGAEALLAWEPHALRAHRRAESRGLAEGRIDHRLARGRPGVCRLALRFYASGVRSSCAKPASM